MMPVKKEADKNFAPPSSPQPSLQSSSREPRRKEPQVNLKPTATDHHSTTASSTVQKRKKHWRSPSNPIEFHHMNTSADCLSINMLKRKSPVSTETSPSIPTTTTNTILSPAQKGQQLNFNKPGGGPASVAVKTNIANSSSKIGRSSLFLNSFGNKLEEAKMTIKELAAAAESTTTSRPSPQSQALYPYEILLLRGPQTNSIKFPMLAELSISPIVSTGSSDYTSTRRHTFTFDSSYCNAGSQTSSESFNSTSLAHGHIDASLRSISFSRSCLLQVILRNPQDNAVAGIFVVKLDLTDMPAESRTILRQKAYKSKCLATDSDDPMDSAPDYLAKFIEIPLKRSYDSTANRQKIHLAGPIKLAFTFNRSNLRYTSPRRSDASAVEPVQKTRTVIQFPSIHQKYFPLFPKEDITDNNNAIASKSHDRLRASSLNTENSTRSFQHGSLCL